MVKSKEMQSGIVSANKKSTKSGSKNVSNAKIEVDLRGEDSWIIVKKQRVTILIPPLSVAKKSEAANVEPSQLQVKPEQITQNRTNLPDQTLPTLPSINEHEKLTPSAPEKVVANARSPVRHFPKVAKSRRPDRRMESEFLKQNGDVKSHKIHWVSERSKTIEKLRLLRALGRPAGNILLNRKLRVSNLERKLKQAGGLSRWLMSLGLGQFVRIFQAQNVNKFQLVNLTMKKLKEMGADAVGPRRKLIHAIDCVCQLV